MESATDRFQRILDENNLTANLQEPVIRKINNGGLIIEASLLSVVFTDPLKEVKNAESTTETMAGPSDTASQNQNET